MKATTILALITILFSAFVTLDNIKVIADKNKSTISYNMSHPMHDWTGISKEVNSAIICNEGKDTIQQVVVAVKISSFDSQNSNRDSHTMEVTEALLYPSITFKSNTITYKNDSLLDVKGILNWHGVKKEINFQAKQRFENKTTSLLGSFDVNMEDYNITPPTLFGIATKEVFSIDFHVFY